MFVLRAHGRKAGRGKDLNAAFVETPLKFFFFGGGSSFEQERKKERKKTCCTVCRRCLPWIYVW